jgi:hypothetical protein
MKLDRQEFAIVANAVLALNESAHCYFGYGPEGVEKLVNYMVGAAYRYCDTQAYFATAGFALSAYTRPDGLRAVRASVAPCVLGRFKTPGTPTAPDTAR